MPPPLRAAAAFGLAYRTMTDDDLPFVAALYASTRTREMAAIGWPVETQRAFLDLQHRAQHGHSRAAYPNAEWLIVERGGMPIGRLYVDESDSALHCIDIALVAQSRGGGIGTAIVTDLQEHGRALGKPVTCYVDKSNEGAMRLYRRLGFEPAEDAGVYRLMVWRPDRSAD